MEIIIFLALCFGGYWLWKHNTFASEKNNKELMMTEIFDCIRSLTILRESSATEHQVQAYISERLIRLLENIRAVTGEDYLSKDSFAYYYMAATARKDAQYINESNFHILLRLARCNSHEEQVSVILDFIQRPPLPEYNYIDYIRRNN